MSTRQGSFGAGGNVEFNLVVTGEQTKTDLQTIITQAEVAERLLRSTLSMVRKLSGGNEDINRLTSDIQRTIGLITQLRIAYNLLMAATPGLNVLGIIGLIGTTASMVDYAGAY